MDEDFRNALADFMNAFHLVFDGDWEFSAMNLDSDNRGFYIAEGGTFINPGIPIEDEDNNWGNRGSLLASYRRLLPYLKKEGIEPDKFFQLALERPATE